MLDDGHINDANGNENVKALMAFSFDLLFLSFSLVCMTDERVGFH